VLAARRGLPRLGLMRVERVDPSGLEPLSESGGEISRQRRRLCVASRLRTEVGELLSLEQIVPDRRFDSHAADGSLELPGCLVAEAENTPARPDPGNAGEGSRWQFDVV
jgi:hypothetical protein